jgi:hypothetical protein
MPKYRHTWDDKVTGNKFRLEILTYDTNYDAAATVITGKEIISIGTMAREMDELPVGLMKPPTLNVTLDFDAMSATMQDRLRNAQSGDLKNLWIFSVSYDGGTTYEIEFCGVQSRTESSQYTITAAGQTIVEYELEDMFWNMISLDGGAGLSTILQGDTNYEFETELYDVDVFSPVQAADSLFALKRFDLKVRPASLSALINRYVGWLRQILPNVYYHYTNPSDLAALALVGSVTGIGADVVGKACTFYEQGSAGSGGSLPRYAGAQLAATDVLVPAYVHDEEGLIGGYASPNDERGVVQYQSGADWLKDLCETFAVKMRWRYIHRTSPGGLDYLEIFVVTGAIFEALETSAVSIDIGTDVLVGDVVVEEGASVIAKAEAEWSGDDQDMGNLQTTNEGTRSQRTFTVRTAFHNNPTVKARLLQKGTLLANPSAAFQDYVTLGLPQTTLLSYVTDVGAYAKIYESLYINDGSTATLYFTTKSDNPPVEAGKLSLEEFTLWCLDVQSESGLPYALTAFYADRFGDRNQSLLTITLPLMSIAGTGYDVATKVTISGLSQLSHLPLNNGQIISHERNYTDGTATLGILLCP